MNPKDKWYLWLNLPTPGRLYWTGVSWDKRSEKAMFFDTMEEAVTEAERRADQTTKAEVVVERSRVNTYA